MSQKAEIKAKKSIYMVWVIPFVAMLLAGWMIFKYYDEKGFEIEIAFNDGEGLAVGKTPLIYKGVKIGQITDLTVRENDITQVVATVTVAKEARLVAKEKNVFWKVEPTVSLTEISGLSTILSGVYITVLTSEKDPNKLAKLADAKSFEAVEDPPIDKFKSGLRLILHSQESGIKNGAPVVYKNIDIGSVEEVTLTEKGVDFSVYIEEKYARLVKKNSSFWEISGVEIRASLAGLRVSMDSLATVITGGIALSSPDEGEPLALGSDRSFRLYDSYQNTFIEDETITLISKEGYNIDAKSSAVYFKGIEAGVVEAVERDAEREETVFKIKLHKDYRHLANVDAYFWLVKPQVGLMSIEGLDALSRGPYITFDTKTKSKELKSDFALHRRSPVMQGLEIRLLSDRGHYLRDGVDIVCYDIIIGTLKKSYISSELNKVVFDIVIADEYAYLVNDSSSFYIQGAVEAEISMEGVYLNVGSLSSMMHSGIVLAIGDESDELTKKNFELFENHKAYKNFVYTHDGGQMFRLTSEQLDSVQTGSPIIFKGIEVGKVLGFSLNQESGLIDVDVYIQAAYKDTVNASTVFYDISGFQLKADTNGLKLATGSVKSLIGGGIAYKTLIKNLSDPLPESFNLYEDEDEAVNQFIPVRFIAKEASGLKTGSKIVYKSLNIGQVSDVNLIGDELVYDAMLKKDFEYLLVKDSLFWVEDFEFSIDQVKNPEALIGGAFIKLIKGHSKSRVSEFELEESAPSKTIYEDGLRVLVTASRLSSLSVGSPVFYRQIQIGSIEKYQLNSDSTGIEIQLFIEEEFRYLVRENSIFYNATALGMDISLFGVKVSTETLSTLIHGGITMVVPNKPKAMASDMHAFKLHDDVDKDWLEYSPKLIAE